MPPELFPPVKVAVFSDTGTQMTDWHTLNPDGSTPWMEVRVPGSNPQYRLHSGKTDDEAEAIIANVPAFEDVMHKFSEGESLKADGFRYL